MKKQSDSNDAQTPYDDETTEVFAAEEPLDETVEIGERVDLTSTTQMPAADATAPVDMNAPLYAQFAGDTDADSGLGNDGGSDDDGNAEHARCDKAVVALFADRAARKVRKERAYSASNARGNVFAAHCRKNYASDKNERIDYVDRG